MIVAIYDNDSGVIRQSLDIPEFLLPIIPLGDNESMVKLPRMAKDEVEYIKDGKLAPKPVSRQ